MSSEQSLVSTSSNPDRQAVIRTPPPPARHAAAATSPSHLGPGNPSPLIGHVWLGLGGAGGGWRTADGVGTYGEEPTFWLLERALALAFPSHEMHVKRIKKVGGKEGSKVRYQVPRRAGFPAFLAVGAGTYLLLRPDCKLHTHLHLLPRTSSLLSLRSRHGPTANNRSRPAALGRHVRSACQAAKLPSPSWRSNRSPVPVLCLVRDRQRPTK